MPDMTSVDVALVTDANLRIKFYSDTRNNAGHGTQCWSEPGLVGDYLIDQITDIDRDEAVDVCTSILAGKVMPGGGRSYRKVVSQSGTGGGRWIVMIGPHLSKSGEVDGVIYARFRAPSSSANLPCDLDPEKFYEAVVENASELVFLLDANGVVQFVNDWADVV